MAYNTSQQFLREELFLHPIPKPNHTPPRPRRIFNDNRYPSSTSTPSIIETSLTSQNIICADHLINSVDICEALFT
ncbi:hypothetical protein EYC84_006674 [Monilinia fructicola]|uniref:Uncharacterized protein n=1 Tax=Monilinia fructicola TaxID=38448 RepID=A0A5M9K4N8_MONFR|nr:hypothetical protein EYC84_006674 [Monilinia fructicola]